MSREEFLDLLRARSGIVCAVGAGGKKTTLYQLTRLHPGKVALTSTVFIPPFPKDLEACVVRDHSERLLPAIRKAATTYRRVAYTQLSSKRGRFEGVPPTQVRAIHQKLGFDVTFVKADGARTRFVKAPSDEEPQLPQDTTTVVPVVSASALGKPLSHRIAHRVKQIEQVSGARLGESLTPFHVARLLTSEQGLLKGAGTAAVVPVINMVDDSERRLSAVETAEEALRLTTRFDYVVLASMRSVDPVVQVVQR